MVFCARLFWYTFIMTGSSIRILKHSISRAELRAIAMEIFGDMAKAVVDIDRGIMAVGAELHADAEATLLANASRQENLWGINLYPDIAGDDWIEFDSMINIRPAQSNRSRDVEDPVIRKKIITVIRRLITE